MKRTKEYIDVSVNEKQVRNLRKGRSVIVRLPGGKMMSLAVRNNLLWRKYIKARKELAKAKSLLHKR